MPRRKGFTLRSAGGALAVKFRKGPLRANGEADECLGYYDPDRREIVIDSRLPDAAMARVVWHEWAHAALLDAGLSIPDFDLEEAAMDAFANSLLAQVGSPVPSALTPPK